MTALLIRQPPRGACCHGHSTAPHPFMGQPKGGGFSWGESHPPPLRWPYYRRSPRAASALPAEAGQGWLWPHSLLRLEVPVNNAQAVQVVQAQGQLSQVKLHVLLCEHDLQQVGGGFSWDRLFLRARALGSRRLPGPGPWPWGGP